MRKRFNALLRFDGNLGNDDGRSDLVIGQSGLLYADFAAANKVTR